MTDITEHGAPKHFDGFIEKVKRPPPARGPGSTGFGRGLARMRACQHRIHSVAVRIWMDNEFYIAPTYRGHGDYELASVLIG